MTSRAQILRLECGGFRDAHHSAQAGLTSEAFMVEAALRSRRVT
jgi:hypothetical protein